MTEFQSARPEEMPFDEPIEEPPEQPDRYVERYPAEKPGGPVDPEPAGSPPEIRKVRFG